ncbi:MAG: MATE family efflux transporter [Coprococcus sp.]|nr:MATE family efflux transporter [Coprococcus sp.]
MKQELTHGNVQKTMILFAGPMILGNLLQQCYNIADTLIVGQFLGAKGLAAVGSAYTLMTFLTSILIGLCIGSGSLWSFYYGKDDRKKLQRSVFSSFLFIGVFSLSMNILVFAGMDWILKVLKTPAELLWMMREYVHIIFGGIFFVFLYNFFAFLLRAMGNSLAPLWFLGIASVLNIILDLFFVAALNQGIAGAAAATVISQGVSGIGLGVYTWIKFKNIILAPDGTESKQAKRGLWPEIKKALPEVVKFSMAASIQQSVMNFGILMIQGLVNSFGTTVMAAFAAAVKIDSFAYMPAQEFGNAFSIFISQNYGAGKRERVRQSVRDSFRTSAIFCIIVSVLVFLAAPYLMMIFIHPSETEIIRIGTEYLRIEGSCYCGIGILFLLYGYYRGIGKPEMSVVLTVISLGTRVALAYALSPVIGVLAIWLSIPTGWILADVTGVVYGGLGKKRWRFE